MNDLALWCLATVGLTAILVDGKILDRFRQLVRSRSVFLGSLLACYQCSGLYSGAVSALCVVEGVTVASLLAYAVAGSGLSMLFASILNLIESVTEAAQNRGTQR